MMTLHGPLNRFFYESCELNFTACVYSARRRFWAGDYNEAMTQTKYAVQHCEAAIERICAVSGDQLMLGEARSVERWEWRKQFAYECGLVALKTDVGVYDPPQLDTLRNAR